MKLHKVAAATLMPVIALGSLVAMGGSANARPGHSARPSVAITGKVTIKPSKNLVDGQTITVSASNFGTDTAAHPTLYVVECDPRIIRKQDERWCDVTPADTGTTPNVGGAGTISFTIRSGADFKAKHKGAECDYGQQGHTCWIVVTDSKTPDDQTTAGFTTFTFKDTRVATKTKLKAKKSGKVGSKLKVAATTTHKAVSTATLDGKVQFKNGKTKCGKAVTEKATGKVSAKCTLKAGKNKITAVYSGDGANYKPSTGKVTVTGKK